MDSPSSFMIPPDFKCPSDPPCGITIDSPNAKKTVKYSFWGMVAMALVGISATPTKEYYRCSQCKKVFYVVDKEERKKAS